MGCSPVIAAWFIVPAGGAGGGGVGVPGDGVGVCLLMQQQPQQHDLSSFKAKQTLSAHAQSHEQPPRAVHVFIASSIRNFLPCFLPNELCQDFIGEPNPRELTRP
jgi:hypothetical protein